jgi:hypothetical protein
MRTVFAFVALFGGFGALVAVSLLGEPDESQETGGTGRWSSYPFSYGWVLLIEITPPGEEFATVVTKREGYYAAPDRRREVGGGMDASGSAWNLQVLTIGEQSWEPAAPGPPPLSWVELQQPTHEVLISGIPPYWGLFAATEETLDSAQPVEEANENDGTPALRYSLTLADLPGLQLYLGATLSLLLPGTQVGDFEDVPVDLWLRADDRKPLRISIRPAQEVLPDTAITFNIQFFQYDDPSIVIEAP